NCAANSAGRRESLGYGRTRSQLRMASCGKTQSRRVSLNRYFSFRSSHLLPSEATTANLNSIHFLREKENLAAVTFYFPFFTPRFGRGGKTPNGVQPGACELSAAANTRSGNICGISMHLRPRLRNGSKSSARISAEH